MCSQLRMGRGSPLCANICERIVSQFKDNVSHREIANNVGLSPSTAHNIVKRFRESGNLCAQMPRAETAAECSVIKRKGDVMPLSQLFLSVL